jgi:alpha-D-ribose 1-methylphosphonate 5-phosphate C-P lyase
VFPRCEHTSEASLVQTRHRIPETPLDEHQILVLQVPQPEPLRQLVPRGLAARHMHAFADYGVRYVKLYEDIARFGRVTLAYDYPVRVNGRYLASPSPIPRFDNPKLNHSRALSLFGAGRERRLYAIPPYTSVESLDFEDHPFEVQRWSVGCALCGSRSSYLDEIGSGTPGKRVFACSDTDYCGERRSSTMAETAGEPPRRAVGGGRP